MSNINVSGAGECNKYTATMSEKQNLASFSFLNSARKYFILQATSIFPI